MDNQYGLKAVEKQNEITEQALEPKRQFETQLDTPLTMGEYNAIADIYQNSDDKERDILKFGQALEYKRNYGLDLDYAYNNIDALNAARGIPQEYNWSTLQSIKNSFKISALNDKLSDLNSAWMDADYAGQDKAEIEKQIADVESQIEGLQDYAPRSLVTNMMKWAAESSVFTLTTIRDSLTWGAGAGLALAGLASLAGVPITAGMTLTGLAWASLASAVGTAATIGGTVSVANKTQGTMYRELRNQGVEKNLARSAASINGYVNGYIETALGVVPAGVGAVLKATGVEKLTATTMARLAMRGTWGTLGKMLANHVVDSIGEGEEEFFQSLADDITDAVVLTISDECKANGVKFDKSVGDVIRDAIKAGGQGFGAALIMGVPTTAVNANVSVKEARRLKYEAKHNPSEADFVRHHENDSAFEGLEKKEVKDMLHQMYKAQNEVPAEDRIDQTTIDSDIIEENVDIESEEDEEAVASEVPEKDIERMENGRLRTQEEKDYDVDLEGNEKHTLKVGTPNSSTRYGRVEYTINKDGSIEIDKVSTKAGFQKAVTKDAVLELMRRYAGQDVTWNPTNAYQQKIKAELENENGGKLQRFASEYNQSEEAELGDFLHEKYGQFTPTQGKLLYGLYNNIAQHYGQTVHEMIADAKANNPRAALRFRYMSDAVKEGLIDKKQARRRGLIDYANRVIYVGENGDITTLFHEGFHMLSKVDKEGAQELVKAIAESKDMESYFKSHRAFFVPQLGLTVDEIMQELSNLSEDSDQWTENQDEILTSMFEAYLRDGKTFSKKLENIFSRIADFFIQIYRTLAGGNHLNDNIIKAFDKILEGNPELKEKFEQTEGVRAQNEVPFIPQTEEEVKEFIKNNLTSPKSDDNIKFGGDIYASEELIAEENRILKEGIDLFDSQELQSSNADRRKSTIHPRCIYKDLKQHKASEILGFKIEVDAGRPTSTGWLQLRQILDVYRNRKFETFRYVLFDKNGVIKYHLAVTSKTPSQTSVAPTNPLLPNDGYDAYIDMLNKTAQSEDLYMVVVHNHPSGNIKASEPDKNVTAGISNRFRDPNLNSTSPWGNNRLWGHMILDHNKFSLHRRGDTQFNLKRNAYEPKFFEVDLSDPAKPVPDPTLKKNFSFPLGEKGLSDSKAFVDMAKKVQSVKDKAAFVYATQSMWVSAIEYIDNANLVDGNQNRIRKEIKKKGLKYGANRLFVITDNIQTFDFLEDNASYLGITDGYDYTGQNFNPSRTTNTKEGNVIFYEGEEGKETIYEPSPLYNTRFQGPTPEERAEADRQYNEVVAKYKGTSEWLKAPNGQPTKLTERQWVQVRTPLFKAWFGDWENDPDNASKVLDPETREPMVVYHSTTLNGSRRFFNFKTDKPAWFTPYKGYSEAFIDKGSGKKSATYEVYLNIKNSIDVGDIDGAVNDVSIKRLADYTGIPTETLQEILNESGGVNIFNITNSESFKELLQEKGFDGIIAREGGGLTSYAVFSPNQIKSATDNVGTFSQSNPSILFQSLGEEGATALDRAEETTYRMDNLKTAKDMEGEGKDAKAIKYATGWERGKDKKWRYEIDDFKKVDPFGNVAWLARHPNVARYLELNRKANAYVLGLSKENLTEAEQKEVDKLKNDAEVMVFSSRQTMANPDGLTLEDYIDAPELFKAYPQLRNVPVVAKEMPTDTSGAFAGADDITDLDNNAIGRIEINKGLFNRARQNNQEAIRKVRSTLIHEVQHAIQDIEGFAEGGNEEVAKQLLKKENKEIQTLLDKADAWEWKLELEATEKEHPELAGTVDLLNTLVKEYEGFPSWMPSEDVRAKGFNLYVRGYDKEGYEDAYKEWQELASKNGIPKKKVINDLTVFRTYKNLAGEVEARNAQARMNMTPEQRRETLLSETEDVAREDQIVLMDGLEAQMALEKDSHSNLLFQSAWHGSGANFDKFDTKFMGTGAGSQSFGWGIYLTQGEDIARNYADQIRYEGEGVYYAIIGNTKSAISYSMSRGESFEKLKAETLKRLELDIIKGWPNPEEVKRAYDTIKNWTEDDVKVRNLYTVRIPDDNGSNYLYWDKPVTKEQAERIVRAEYPKYDTATDEAKETLLNLTYLDRTGEEVYRELEKKLAKKQAEGTLTIVSDSGTVDVAPKAASEFLNRAGFVGIDYPAGTIFGGGNGKRNFVIFNADDINIQTHIRYQNRLTEDERSQLVEEARDFDTFDDFLNYLSIMNGWIDPAQYSDALPVLDEIYGEAHGNTREKAKLDIDLSGLTDDEKDRTFEEYIDGDGIKVIMNLLHDMYTTYYGLWYAHGGLEDDEIAEVESLNARLKEFENNASSFIYNLAKSKKELTDKKYNSIRNVMKKNIRMYRELIADTLESETLRSDAEPDIAGVRTEERPTLADRGELEKDAGTSLDDKVEGEIEKKLDQLDKELSDDEKAAEALTKELDSLMGELKSELTPEEEKALKNIQFLERFRGRKDEYAKALKKKIDNGEAISQAENTRLETVAKKIKELEQALAKFNDKQKAKNYIDKQNALKELKADIREKQKQRRALKEMHEYKHKLVSYLQRKVPKSVAYEYKGMIEAIISMFSDVSGYDNNITYRGKSLTPKEFREAVDKDGALDELSKYQLKRYDGKSLADYTVEELERLADVKKRLVNIGRQMWQAKVDARNAEAAQIRQIILNHLRKNPKYTTAPLPDTEEDKKAKKSFRKKFSEMFTGTIPMSRITQMLDGGEKGFIYDLLTRDKRLVQDMERLAVRERINRVQELMDKLGVKKEDFYKPVEMSIRQSDDLGPASEIEKYTDTYTLGQLIYGIMAQRNIRNKYAFMFGDLVTQDEKAILNHNNDLIYDLGMKRNERFVKQAEEILKQYPNLMQVADAIVKDWQDINNKTRLNQVMIDEYNQGLDMEDFYMPIKRLDFNGTSLAQTIADDVFNQNAGKNRTTPKKGFTKARFDITPDQQMRTNMDFLELWLNSVDEQEHLIATNAYVRKLNRVFKGRGSNDLRSAIENVYGDHINDYISKYINEIANPPATMEDRNVSKWIRFLRGRLYEAYLGFKLSSFVLQVITSPAPFLREVNPLQLSEYILKVMANPSKYWKFITERSTMMESRSIDPILAGIKKEKNDFTANQFVRTYHKALAFGTGLLEVADRWMVSAGWLACYEKAMAERQDAINSGDMTQMQAELEASQYADEVVLETQPTGDFTELSPMFKTKSAAWQALTQFTTSLNVIWTNLLYDARTDLQNRNFKRAIMTAFAYALAGTILYAVQDYEPPEDDETWIKDTILKLLYGMTSQGVSSVPLLGSDIDKFFKETLTGERQYTARKLYPAFDTAREAVTRITQGKFDLKTLGKVTESIGLFVGLPVSGGKELLHIFRDRDGNWRYRGKRLSDNELLDFILKEKWQSVLGRRDNYGHK